MKNKPVLILDADYFQIPNLEPEQELAVAVIAQAFRDVDWFNRPPKRPNTSSALSDWQAARLAAYDAARFLRGSEDLDYWCQLAGLNCDVSDMAMRYHPKIKTI